MIKQQFN